MHFIYPFSIEIIFDLKDPDRTCFAKYRIPTTLLLFSRVSIFIKLWKEVHGAQSGIFIPGSSIDVLQGQNSHTIVLDRFVFYIKMYRNGSGTCCETRTNERDGATPYDNNASKVINAS